MDHITTSGLNILCVISVGRTSRTSRSTCISHFFEGVDRHMHFCINVFCAPCPGLINRKFRSFDLASEHCCIQIVCGRLALTCLTDDKPLGVVPRTSKGVALTRKSHLWRLPNVIPGYFLVCGIHHVGLNDLSCPFHLWDLFHDHGIPMLMLVLSLTTCMLLFSLSAPR